MSDYATIGGVYENKGDVEIGIRVDNSLCDGYTLKAQVVM
jgi:hypothetical protein